MRVENVKLRDEDRDTIMGRAADAAPDFYMSLVKAGAVTMGEALPMSLVMIDPRTSVSDDINHCVMRALNMGQELPTYLMAGGKDHWFATLPLNEEGQNRMIADNPTVPFTAGGTTIEGGDTWDGAVKDRAGAEWVVRTNWLLINEALVLPRDAVDSAGDARTQDYSTEDAWKEFLPKKPLGGWDN